MNKRFKVIAALIAVFSFGFTVAAQNGSYAFSGFGGGLPSSVTKMTDDGTIHDITLLRSDDDDSSGSGAGKVVLIVVGSIVVTGLLVAGGIWLFRSATDSCSDSCNTSCNNMCEDSLGQLCSDSISQSCSKSGVKNIFATGLSLMPSYIP